METVAELALAYEVYPTLINRWKKELQESGQALFLRVSSARSAFTRMLGELICKQNKFTDREGFPSTLRIDAYHAEERRIDPTLERIAKGFTPERKSSFNEMNQLQDSCGFGQDCVTL